MQHASQCGGGVFPMTSRQQPISQPAVRTAGALGSTLLVFMRYFHGNSHTSCLLSAFTNRSRGGGSRQMEKSDAMPPLNSHATASATAKRGIIIYCTRFPLRIRSKLTELKREKGSRHCLSNKHDPDGCCLGWNEDLSGQDSAADQAHIGMKPWTSVTAS